VRACKRGGGERKREEGGYEMVVDIEYNIE
jgi:hypothetical protein